MTKETANRLSVIHDHIEKSGARSAWARGVKNYALDMLDELADAIRGGWQDADVLQSSRLLEKALLNGADTWEQYAWGGCGLVYNEDIARALCAPWELKKTDYGRKEPNSREQWPDVEARARFQAAQLIKEAARQA